MLLPRHSWRPRFLNNWQCLMSGCVAFFCRYVLFCWIPPCQKYHALDGEGKHGLIATYMKEGGIKNLSWVASYLESSETKETEMQEDEKGFFAMHKILGFHGLVVGTNLAQERAPVVLKALLEENHKENDLDPNDKGLVEENQAVRELNKYFYIHRVQKESVASTKKTQMDLSADNLKIANLKNALENTAPPSIKVENPDHQGGFGDRKGQGGEGAGHCQGLLRGDQGFEQSLL